jgi:hypothetical protein
MTTDPRPPSQPGPADTAPTSGQRTPQQLYTRAGLALGTEQAAEVLRPGPHELVSILAITARAPVDQAARGPFLAGVAEGILRVVRQLQMITTPHACGQCDGPLHFDRMSGEYATFTCTACGWWHIAADCCHISYPVPDEPSPPPGEPWPVTGPVATLIRAAEANAAAATDTLDEEVHAVASEAASRVNNDGVAAQILHLLEWGISVEHLRSLLMPATAGMDDEPGGQQS